MAHLSKSVAALDVKDSFDRDGYLTGFSLIECKVWARTKCIMKTSTIARASSK